MTRFAVARWTSLTGVLVAVASGFLLHEARAEPARRVAKPAEAVREALQREIYGQSEVRAALLASASEHTPQYAPAMWQRGYIGDAKRGWLRPEEYLQNAKLAARLSAYERERAKMPDTIAGNLQLADWCRQEELADQERAHLTRVVDLAPDHAAARQRLGFVRRGGIWISREEIARERTDAAARRAALARWEGKLQELREGLEHKSQQRREFARARLLEISDADAIPALEAVFASAALEVLTPVLDTVAAISDPEASLALTRFAVRGRSEPIREAAADRLKRRDFDSYVPSLLASMYSPVVSQFTAVRLPGGRIGYRHEFAREAQDRVELLRLDTEYRRVVVAGGDRRDSRERALTDAAMTARAREQAANAQNELTTRVNDRLAWVLALATGEDLPAEPVAWWGWWNRRNEVFIATEKPTSTIYDLQRVAVVDRVSDPSGGEGSGNSVTFTGGGGGGMDCLAAGTRVWRPQGATEIEKLRVGDLVVAQDADSGELALKPVVKTTVRPAGRLIRITAGGETLAASGGHPFWVAGEGWIKARELRSGHVLHAANGPVHVSTVEEVAEEVTYNLVVADFSTYFVGYSRILSHDNSHRQPTRALVPGLLPE